MTLPEIDWRILLSEEEIASVLTDQYARFARPVSEALAVFLDGLPRDRQEQIVRDQIGLPATAGVSQRLVALARRCPALHKLGQIVARDRRLTPTLRRHLQELESLPPATPLGLIRDVLGRELGPLHRLGIELRPPALAEASVAVVVPFERMQDFRSGQPRHGVFKVLKPGIEAMLDQDLAHLQRIGE